MSHLGLNLAVALWLTLTLGCAISHCNGVERLLVTEFIFMLTNLDRTVPHAREVLDLVAETGLRHVGFKDVGASAELQRELTSRAHDAGLTVHLEVVSTSADDEKRSMDAAVGAGVDWVLGGQFADTSREQLRGSGIKFAPFPGRIVGHPSVLEGTVDEIAAHAAELSSKDGVDGVDLLAYRHRTADIPLLIRSTVEAVGGPVIVAGSVTTAEQVRIIAEAGAWAFTIGSAIFEGQLPAERDVHSQVLAALRFADAARV